MAGRGQSGSAQITGRLFFLVTLAFGWSSSEANAEPSDKVRWLMNQPLSLFTWGISRGQRSLQNTLKHQGFPGIVSGSYDWDKNRITFSYFEQEGGKPRGEQEARCSTVIRLMREATGLKAKQYLGHSFLAGNFKQNGHVAKDRPSDVEGEIDRITVVSAILPVGQHDQKPVHCEGDVDEEGFRLIR